MTQTLRYENLEQGLVERLLAEGGAIYVELPPARAEPLAALLALARNCLGWKDLPLLRRVGSFVRGLFLIGRILFFHSKLLSLISVVVLDSGAQTWHSRPDGTVVFQFVRRAEA